MFTHWNRVLLSIIGSKNIVAGGASVSDGLHPVTEEESGDEADGSGEVQANTVDVAVEGPAEEPVVR